MGLLELLSHVSGYAHSLPDVKAVLQQSLHLCMLIQSGNYRELASRCIMDIEVSGFKVQMSAFLAFNTSDNI